jgi:hypothetical protein
VKHESESQHDAGNHLAKYFTLPGRILVVVTVILAAAAPFAVFWFLNDSLTPGKYPLWFFALPVWIGLAFVFTVVIAILRRLRIPILRQQVRADPEQPRKDATPTNTQ